MQFHKGDDLTAVINETIRCRDLIEHRLHFKMAQDGVDGHLLSLLALQEGNTVADSPAEYFRRPNVAQFEEGLLSRNLPVSIMWYLSSKSMTLYLLEQYDDVVSTATQAEA
jgi:hypothetical protein